MSEEPKKRGRKKKTIDLSELIDIEEIEEESASPFFVTCSICGNTKRVTTFKNKYICSKCIGYIRSRN